MKTTNEILDQLYLSANDLKKLIPTLGINACRQFIAEIAQEEREKGAFVPICKTKIAPTKAIRKKLKI